MNRSRHVVVVVGILLGAAVAGCGMQDEPNGAGRAQETSFPSEPAVPLTSPSESSSQATKPERLTDDQARLDEQLREAAWDNNVAMAAS